MLLDRTKEIPINKKVEAIEKYINKKGSLRDISREIGVPHQTFSYWVKKYKIGGIENLNKKLLVRSRPLRNREKNIILIKERCPALTVNKARQMLIKKGINISATSIWSTWERFGYVDRKANKESYPLDIFVSLTPEFECIIEKAKLFFEKGDYKKAAQILNKPFCLPQCQLLKKIPKKYLSLKRKLECYYLEFGEIPFTQYLTEIRQIGRSLEKKGYIYSSIIVNFLELKVLSFLRRLKEKEQVLNLLSNKLIGMKNISLKFAYNYEKVSTYYSLLKIDKALPAEKICKKLIYYLPYPYYFKRFGDLLVVIGKYKKAVEYYTKALKEISNKYIDVKIAFYKYNSAGKYSECKRSLKKLQSLKNSKSIGSIYSLMEAYIYFGQGNLIEAKRCFLKSLEKAETYQLVNNIYTASIGISAVSAALNKKSDSMEYLKNILPMMKKYNLKSETFVLKCLIDPKKNIPKIYNKIPPLKLINLFKTANKTRKIGDYNKVVKYVKQEELLCIFHRLCMFFPEPVLQMIENGKETGLPKEILRYPLFNQKSLIYHIEFLGKLKIIKGNYRLKKITISPKDSAFLIHLSLRKQHKILLKDLYNNFWSKSIYPLNNLSHLLVRIKKILSLPSKLMGIKGEFLIWDCYFTTDYDDYKEIITHARAFERVGEWRLAKKEYLRSFRLFHDKPFKKMYDNWSDEKQNEIILDYENEINSFTKKLIARGRIEEAQRILKRAEKILIS